MCASDDPLCYLETTVLAKTVLVLMDDVPYYVNKRKNHKMYTGQLQRMRVKDHVALSSKGRTLLSVGMS